jgi:hypothetical protein
MKVLRVLKGTLFSVRQPNFYEGNLDVVSQVECNLSVEGLTYFLTNGSLLLVALFSEILAFEAEDDLASPRGPEQRCYASPAAH